MSEPDNTKLNRHSIIYRGLSNGAQGRRGLMVHIENGGEGVQGRRCTKGRGVVHRRNGAVKREERGAATI